MVSITAIKNTIDAEDEKKILNSDIEELTEYYVQDYILPIIEKTDQQPTVKKEGRVQSGWESYVNVTIGIPLVTKEKLEKVISRRANPYLMGVRFRLENCRIVTDVQISSQSQNSSGRVTDEIKTIDTVIGQKNGNVNSGNKMLKDRIREYLTQKQSSLQQENDFMDSLVEGIPVKLEKDDSAPVVDLSVRKKIHVLMPEGKKKGAEPYLESDALSAVLELIQNQGRSFELTPKVFSKLDEESLRDIILSSLNAILKGKATAESFVKTGKTDILLKLKVKGGILSAECKFWNGEKLYQETIDQHFGYLTLRQNYAIQITFSKKRGFTDVCEKATNATESHPTYVQGSTKKIEDSYFITQHTFPEDPKKKVEIHHLIYNLHILEK